MYINKANAYLKALNGKTATAAVALIMFNLATAAHALGGKFIMCLYSPTHLITEGMIILGTTLTLQNTLVATFTTSYLWFFSFVQVMSIILL